MSAHDLHYFLTRLAIGLTLGLFFYYWRRRGR